MMARFTMIGVAFEVMALILVLSFFNGIQDFQLDFYRSYEPELRISPNKGKFFSFSPQDFTHLKQVQGVDFAIGELKDQVLLKYGDYQLVADMIGVDTNFILSKSFKKSIVAGKYSFYFNGFPVALMGEGLFLSLGMDAGKTLYPIEIYYPNRENLRKFSLLSGANLEQSSIMPAGIFRVDPLFDSQSILVDIHFMVDLIGQPGNYSSIRIRCSDPQKVQAELRPWLMSKGLSVLTLEEQHSSVLQAIKVERLFVMLMMVCIIIVASFTLFFSLSLLVVEKKKDLKTLVSLGIQPRQIFKIFLFEGLIITFVGIVLGIILAVILAYIQNYFGIIKTGLSSDLLDSYPLKLLLEDFILVSIIVLIIGSLASIYPAKKAVRFSYD